MADTLKARIELVGDAQKIERGATYFLQVKQEMDQRQLAELGAAIDNSIGRQTGAMFVLLPHWLEVVNNPNEENSNDSGKALPVPSNR